MKTLRRMDLRVHWNAQAAADASLTLAAQLPTAAFDSVFPCGPDSRDCLPQPGITNPAEYLDFLNRERPTWRLAYRNFKDYEALVTNQSVEALPGVAGVRWYEIRWDAAGSYSSHQHGNHAFALFLLSTLSKALPPFNPNFAAMVSREICSTGVLQKKHTNTA
jgi:hypothetical protein